MLLQRLLIVLAACTALLAATPVQAQADTFPVTGQDLRGVIAEVLSSRLDHLDIEYVSPDGSSGNEGYAIAYDWKWEKPKTADRDDTDKIFNASDLRITAFANGKHATGDTLNPANLARAGFDFGYMRADLGELQKRLAPAQSQAYQACLLPLDPTDPEYDAKSNACAIDHGVFEVRQANQSDNWVYGLNARATIEADGDYSQKQYVYGLEGFINVRPHADSALRTANLLDYPFRFTRAVLSGEDSSDYRASWPVIRLGIHTVDVAENDPRESVAPEEDSFERAYGELAFNSVLAFVDGNPVRVGLSYQVYRELDPVPAIETAGLDTFEFFSASIEVPAGIVTELLPESSSFYLSYTNGDLPFDRESVRAFQVGWQTNLDLASLFAPE